MSDEPIILNPFNSHLATLRNNIRDGLMQALDKKVYDFSKPDDAAEWYDRTLMGISKDPTITSEINHTKYPDDVLLTILSSQGIHLEGIHQLASIEYTTIDGEGRYGHTFNVKFPGKVKTVSIDCELD